MGEGFQGKVQGGGGVCAKKPDRWKTSVFLGEKRAEEGWIFGARQFGIAPVLGWAENVPRGTLPALGWFPNCSTWNIGRCKLTKERCRLIVG